jgi:hypothetical protein
MATDRSTRAQRPAEPPDAATSAESLDFTDPAAVAVWLAGLRASFDDLDGAVEDMLRPAEERELGPVLHRKHYADARRQVFQALAYAAGDEPEVEPDSEGGCAP